MKVDNVPVSGWVALFEASAPNEKGERGFTPGSRIWGSQKEAAEFSPHAVGFAQIAGDVTIFDPK